MWRIPPPLVAGIGDAQSALITSDTYVGDLYTYLGSPSGRQDVTITVDGADAGEIIITNAWTAGSTFTFIATNNGRILGMGGAGGAGAPDLGATGDVATAGTSGTAAITNQGNYSVAIDADDGYIYGGGGGGGGGSYTDTGAGGDPGGGGGGGQGWTGGAGGAAGNPFTGVPAPTAGTAGTRSLAGSGGSGGGVTIGTSDGGDGGTWGLGGATGRSSDMLVGFGEFAVFLYHGGLGGSAGRAYSSSASQATYSGAKSEATLRSEGRIKGETGGGGNYLVLPSFNFNVVGFDIQPTNDSIGVGFQSDGAYLKVDTTKVPAPTPSTTYWLTGGSGTGSEWEVRERGETGDTDGGAWTSQAAVPGTWVQLSTFMQWSKNYTGSGAKAALFEFRRSDIPGTTSTSDEVMGSVFVKIAISSEP